MQIVASVEQSYHGGDREVRMHVFLAIAAVALLVLPLHAKRQPRGWQDAKVLHVQRPNERGAEGAPENPVGSVTQMGGGKPSVPTLESTSRGETWVYFVELEGRTYIAGYDWPRRKSFLGTLGAGKSVKAFVDRRSLYLLDQKGKEWKLRLLQK
jgi:hypothetical protein